MKEKTKNVVVRALLLRPIDFEMYQKERATGLTAMIYLTPWSVQAFLLGVLGALGWWRR